MHVYCMLVKDKTLRNFVAVVFHLLFFFFLLHIFSVAPSNFSGACYMHLTWFATCNAGL
jgi:hypothetical protein